MEKRSLFSKMFGGKASPKTTTRYEMLSGQDTFYKWDGRLYQSDIVRSAIRPKVNAIGKLNAKHLRGTGDALKINPDANMRVLLTRPNPYMSMQDFLMKMTWQRELFHNAFAYVQRDGRGYPIAIYPVPYSGIRLLEAGGELFVEFRFMFSQVMTVPYTDLIHLRKDFNENDIFGDSGNLAVKGIMEVVTTTDQGIIKAVKNSNIVKWIMTFKQALQPEDIQLNIDKFVKNYLDIEKGGSGVAHADPRYTLDQVKQDTFVPTALQADKTIQRLYSYFGVNEAIIQNKFNEDQWNAFYEAEVEPILIQLSNEFTNSFFTLKEQAFGNRIVFEASNLAYASMTTKLNLLQMVDRGAMTPNEWRTVLNLGPIEGGDKPIRRLDTALVTDGNTTDGTVDENV